MQKDAAIAITGAAGFIASYLVGYLNRMGFENLYLVDEFDRPEKAANLEGKRYTQQIERLVFQDWCILHPGKIQYMFHLGARTDTTEMDYEVHRRLNVEYSKDMWRICTEQRIPMVYASSAATYGGGEHGYSDSHHVVPELRPLNPYGQSKQDFDVWALEQTEMPPFWAGVKFFNVYGPNEYHKSRMASVIMHAHRQIGQTGGMKLFRSHNPAYSDGGQMRDFVYVRDVAQMCTWLMEAKPESGLYNVGSGKARSFLDLARSVFAALGVPEEISFIDTPEDIRDKYQYFTEADMSKLKAAGYPGELTSLEAGIDDYVRNYLVPNAYF
jgi:ADP-L-glycero-D-manno-heptose 6-epimerase